MEGRARPWGRPACLLPVYETLWSGRVARRPNGPSRPSYKSDTTGLPIESSSPPVVSQDEWHLLGGASGAAQMTERTDCLLGESTTVPPLGGTPVDSLSTPLPPTECIRPQPPDPPGWDNGSLVEPNARTRISDAVVGPRDCWRHGDPPAGRGLRLAHAGFLVPSDAWPHSLH